MKYTFVKTNSLKLNGILAYIPDEEYIVCRQNDEYVVFRNEDIVQRFKIKPYCGYVRKITWLSDTFFVECDNGIVFTMSMGTGKIKKLRTSGTSLLSNDGEYILTTPSNYIISSRTLMLECALQHCMDFVVKFCFNHERTRVFTVANRSRHIRTWEFPSGKSCYESFTVDAVILRICINADGILALHTRLDLQLFDTKTQTMLTRIPTPLFGGLQFTPNSKHLFMGNPIHMIDPKNGDLLHSVLPMYFGTRCVATDTEVIIIDGGSLTRFKYFSTTVSLYALYMASGLKRFDGDLGIMRTIINHRCHQVPSLA